MTDTTIAISQQTRDELFRLKDTPDETYDEILRQLLADKQPA